MWLARAAATRLSDSMNQRLVQHGSISLGISKGEKQLACCLNSFNNSYHATCAYTLVLDYGVKTLPVAPFNMSPTFSEWRKLPISLSELCINTTLRCGQSFRYGNVPTAFLLCL